MKRRGRRSRRFGHSSDSFRNEPRLLSRIYMIVDMEPQNESQQLENVARKPFASIKRRQYLISRLRVENMAGRLGKRQGFRVEPFVTVIDLWEKVLMSRTTTLAYLWTAITFGLHAIPRARIIKLPGGEIFVASTILDKLAHVILFGILGFLWSRGFGYRAFTTVLMGLGYGIALELFQEWLVRGRTGSIADLIADGVGLVIGVAVAVRYSRSTAPAV